jgi:hypothetical protein
MLYIYKNAKNTSLTRPVRGSSREQNPYRITTEESYYPYYYSSHGTIKGMPYSMVNEKDIKGYILLLRRGRKE